MNLLYGQHIFDNITAYHVLSTHLCQKYHLDIYCYLLTYLSLLVYFFVVTML